VELGSSLSVQTFLRVGAFVSATQRIWFGDGLSAGDDVLDGGALSVFAIGNFGSNESISSNVQMGGALSVLKVTLLRDSLSMNESVIVQSLSVAGSVPAALTPHVKDSASFDSYFHETVFLASQF
jgi:hypothetical protein